MVTNMVANNALSGILSSQQALKNSSNNVANVNTEGYTKTISAFNNNIDHVTLKDKNSSSLLFNSLIRSNSDKSFYDERKINLSNIEQNFIGMDKLIQNVNINVSTDIPDEGTLNQSIELLSDNLNNIQDNLKKDMNSNEAYYSSTLDEVKPYFDELSSVQRYINENYNPSLLSKQNELITKISEYIKVEVTDSTKFKNVKELQTDKGIVFNEAGFNENNISGGKLGSIEENGTILLKQHDNIKTFINDFKNDLNTVNKSGLNNKEMFTENGVQVDLNKNYSSDNENLQGIRNTISTYTSQWNNNQLTLGNSVQQSRLSFDISQNMFNSVKENYTKETGVDLNEEAVNQMKYRQMYDSLLKLIKTEDDMMKSLINIV